MARRPAVLLGLLGLLGTAAGLLGPRVGLSPRRLSLAPLRLQNELINDGVDDERRLASDLQAFRHWLQFHGADTDRLCVTEAGDQGWGLKLRDDAMPVSAGDVLGRVPLSACLSGQSGRGPGQANDMAKDKIWALVDKLPPALWRLRLALVLLAERAQRASLYNAYVRQFPSRFEGAPIFYTPEEIAALQDGPLVEKVTERARFLLRYAADVLPALAGTPEDPFDGQYADVNAVGWAVCSAASRSFVPHPSGAELDGGIAAAGKPAAEAAEALLIPVFDLLNHEPDASNAAASLRYSADGAAVELVALRDVAPGEDLTAFYGPLSSTQTLLDFGYVDLDNPHESVDLDFSATFLAEARRAARMPREQFGREARVRGRVIPNKSKRGSGKASNAGRRRQRKLEARARSEEQSAREAFRMAVKSIENKEKGLEPDSEGMLILRKGESVPKEIAENFNVVEVDDDGEDDDVAAKDEEEDAAAAEPEATSVYPWQLRWLERLRLAGPDADITVKLGRADGKWAMDARAIAGLRVLFCEDEDELEPWAGVGTALDALALRDDLGELQRDAVRQAAYRRLGDVDAPLDTPNQRRVLALASAVGAVRLRDFKGSVKDDEALLGIGVEPVVRTEEAEVEVEEEEMVQVGEEEPTDDDEPGFLSLSEVLKRLPNLPTRPGGPAPPTQAEIEEEDEELGAAAEEEEEAAPAADVLRPVELGQEKELLFYFAKQVQDLGVMVQQAEAGELTDEQTDQVKMLLEPLGMSSSSLAQLDLSDAGLEEYRALNMDMLEMQSTLDALTAGREEEDPELAKARTKAQMLGSIVPGSAEAEEAAAFLKVIEEDKKKAAEEAAAAAATPQLSPALRAAVTLRLSKKRALRAAIADMSAAVKRIGEPGSGVDVDEKWEKANGVGRHRPNAALWEEEAGSGEPPTPPDAVDGVLREFGPKFDL